MSRLNNLILWALVVMVSIVLSTPFLLTGLVTIPFVTVAALMIILGQKIATRSSENLIPITAFILTLILSIALVVLLINLDMIHKRGDGYQSSIVIDGLTIILPLTFLGLFIKGKRKRQRSLRDSHLEGRY